MTKLPRFAAVTTAALLVAGSVAAYTPYSTLRHDHDSIGDAVDAMPNSDLNGTLNRISSLYTRSAVRDLPSSAFVDGVLPNNWETNMLGALADLREDVKFEFADLTLEQKMVIIQTVEVVVTSRGADLYAGWAGTPCIPSPEHPCPIPLSPPVVAQLDGVAATFRGPINAFIDDFNASEGTSIPHVGTVNSSNLDSILDNIRTTMLTIKGVESIDD